MPPIIREAEISDVPVILSLLADFAAFENLSEFLTITEDDLREAMFGESSFVEGLICEYEGQTAGFAIFYPRFSSFRGQLGYYLEDIYIDSAYRGRGFGEALLREIARKLAGFRTRLVVNGRPDLAELTGAAGVQLPAEGLAIVDAITGLEGYHPLPSVRADLLAKLGRTAEARAELERAASLTSNAKEREALERRAEAL